MKSDSEALLKNYHSILITVMRSYEKQKKGVNPKMKITPKELRQIIKEEYEQVISEGRYRQATTEPELYDALKDAIGNHSDYMVMGVLRGVLDDRKDQRAAELNEDGHTDVPSAIRKLKTSMEDAMEILNALEQMPDTELPSWWMSKITLAADYLNKSRDYLLVSEEINEVYSDKQRRWACAQMRDGFKGERSLTKKQAKEMCTGPMLKAGDKK